VVPGLDAPAIGKVLTDSPVVRKISFTGSTEVGKILMRQCADNVKKLSLELGGNAPFIVFDDADVDAAVAGAVTSKYRNAGQTCVCANRIFVQAAVYEDFMKKFTAAVAQQKVGSGLEQGVQVGPLINAEALDKVQRLVADAVGKGAVVATGGAALGGTFFQPTVLAGVKAGMDILDAEIFGPVAPVVRFQDEKEAVALANDTPYGLASYFYGRDISRIFRVAEALDYGMVGVNTGLLGTAAAPFGGMKESGLGREGSKYGLEDFLEIKYICIGI
jgi:succinate-semialdehyde dehydrogenase / glutarate-semialdehyde dehydrogenase